MKETKSYLEIFPGIIIPTRPKEANKERRACKNLNSDINQDRMGASLGAISIL